MKPFLNLTAAKNLYYGCIYSVIRYCIVVWGGVLQCSQRGRSLQSLQKKIVHNLFWKFHERSTCLFKSMKILKIADVHTFYAALCMYKIVKLNSCPMIDNYIELNHYSPSYETWNRNRLILPFPRVNAIKINFTYQLNNVWNDRCTWSYQRCWIYKYIQETTLSTYSRYLLATSFSRIF